MECLSKGRAVNPLQIPGFKSLEAVNFQQGAV